MRALVAALRRLAEATLASDPAAASAASQAVRAASAAASGAAAQESPVASSGGEAGNLGHVARLGLLGSAKVAELVSDHYGGRQADSLKTEALVALAQAAAAAGEQALAGRGGPHLPDARVTPAQAAALAEGLAAAETGRSASHPGAEQVREWLRLAVAGDIGDAARGGTVVTVRAAESALVAARTWTWLGQPPVQRGGRAAESPGVALDLRCERAAIRLARHCHRRLASVAAASGSLSPAAGSSAAAPARHLRQEASSRSRPDPTALAALQLVAAAAATGQRSATAGAGLAEAAVAATWSLLGTRDSGPPAAVVVRWPGLPGPAWVPWPSAVAMLLSSVPAPELPSGAEAALAAAALQGGNRVAAAALATLALARASTEGGPAAFGSALQGVLEAALGGEGTDAGALARATAELVAGARVSADQVRAVAHDLAAAGGSLALPAQDAAPPQGTVDTVAALAAAAAGRLARGGAVGLLHDSMADPPLARAAPSVLEELMAPALPPLQAPRRRVPQPPSPPSSRSADLLDELERLMLGVGSAEPPSPSPSVSASSRSTADAGGPSSAEARWEAILARALDGCAGEAACATVASVAVAVSLRSGPPGAAPAWSSSPGVEAAMRHAASECSACGPRGKLALGLASDAAKSSAAPPWLRPLAALL